MIGKMKRASENKEARRCMWVRGEGEGGGGRRGWRRGDGGCVGSTPK